jgi:hypothetical protein
VRKLVEEKILVGFDADIAASSTRADVDKCYQLKIRGGEEVETAFSSLERISTPPYHC